MKSLLFAVVALMLVPGFALAMCSDRKIPSSASGCAEGQIWDAETLRCTSAVTG
ncbi:hypothetical protein ACFQXB_03735 [Plastorhodobacter daqingensis]|uniref:Adenylosuccinate lyase n=1 Tax=Plastorhodobacter daqingensis TaxID=1387281 RepID=A0ABW2UGI9_9RHOB